MSVAPPSPRPRRIAAPSWLDLRLVLGVLLVLGSVLVGAKVVSGASRTYPVVAVTRTLSAGTIVTVSDVRLAQVQLPHHGHGVYLSATRDAVGKKLSRPVAQGELLAASAITSVGSQTTVTVPLAAGSAPQLHSGQRIKIWVSTSSCSSLSLLDDVAVQSVRLDQGSFGTGTGGQDVVISVAPAQANRVITALALDGAKLRAGVLVGAAAAPTPSPTPGADESTLPDITACASPSR